MDVHFEMFVLLVLMFFVTVPASADAVSHDPDKIIGGQPAKPGQFPFIVSLQHSYNKAHFCSAGIITKRWLLTAAHCIIKKRIEAFVVFGGSIYLNETQSGTYYSVQKKRIHPAYRNSRRLVDDVGMIEVAEEILFNKNSQPIKLPFDIDVKPGDEAIALGWGDTSYPDGFTPNHLQFLKSKIVNIDKCAAIMGYPFGDGHLCFGGDDQLGLCHGDSGSPLVFVANNVSYVIGLVSWGTPCAVGHPDVFMKVSNFLTWIEEQISSDL